MAALVKKSTVHHHKTKALDTSSDDKNWNPVMKPELNLTKATPDFFLKNRVTVYKFLVP